MLACLFVGYWICAFGCFSDCVYCVVEFVGSRVCLCLGECFFVGWPVGVFIRVCVFVYLSSSVSLITYVWYVRYV